MARAGSRQTSDDAMRAGSSTPERVGGASAADAVTGLLTPPLDPRLAGE
jgi:hypothetical protein